MDLESSTDKILMELQPSIELPELLVEQENVHPSQQSGLISITDAPFLHVSSDPEDVQFGVGEIAVSHDGFSVLDSVEKLNEKFGTLSNVVTFKLDKPPPHVNAKNYVTEVLSSILETVFEECHPNDKVGLALKSSDPQVLNEACLSFRNPEQATVDKLMNVVEKFMQSTKDFLTHGPLILTATRVMMPHGCANDAGMDPINSSIPRKATITIQNSDKLCLARAIVVAIAHGKYNDEQDPKKKHEYLNTYKHITRTDRNFQKLEAERLCRKAQVNLKMHGGGIPEIHKFQDYLKEYSIFVWSDHTGNVIMYRGLNQDTRKHLYLFYSRNKDGNGHFNVITNLKAFFEAEYYCLKCMLKYRTLDSHICPDKCPMCRSEPVCKPLGDPMECYHCNHQFTSKKCLINHMRSGSYVNNKSVCEAKTLCKICATIYDRKPYTSEKNKKKNENFKHDCAFKYCRTCYNTVPVEKHYCFVTPRQPFNKKEFEHTQIIYFDFECYIDSVTQEHIPNLCISHTVCQKCRNKPETDYECNTCGRRERIFKDDNALSGFYNYIISEKLPKNIKKRIAISHNGKAYDNQFILRYAVENQKVLPEVILSGQKIIGMTIGRVIFKDSISFVPMALKKLPKIFGIEDKSKGYFPHFFNKPENWNYIGNLPSPEAYGCNQMQPGDHDEFMKWYEKKSKTDVFNFKKDIVNYCRLDVEILRRCFENFREIFYTLNSVEPILECYTIASACMLTFRRKYLKKNTIGITPAKGYRLTDNQSYKAHLWLRWIQYTKKIHNFETSYDGKEKRIPVSFYNQNTNTHHTTKVDGYDPNTKHIYEFNGCFWHGHSCIVKHHTGEFAFTMIERLESTKKREQMFLEAGYTVTSIWECEFDRLYNNNEDLRNYISLYEDEKFKPLTTRDAFFGGRTDALKCYTKANEALDEEIRYVDVCSLYPYVQATKLYPVGHPIITVYPNCSKDIGEKCGIIKAKVLPPHELLIPVLPYRVKGKMLVPLCRSCADVDNKGICNHLDEERSITGTWISFELKKAVEKGYRILEVYETWYYNTQGYSSVEKVSDKLYTEYNINQNIQHNWVLNLEGPKHGLFTQYVRDFLKIKTECSGYPDNVKTIEDREKYIKEYEERENVKLDPSKIENNPGKRQLAKLCLNSFWGKFAQRNDLTKYEYIISPDQLYTLLTNIEVEVMSIQEITPDILIVKYTDRSVAEKQPAFSSVTTAAFVTAHARLHLYSYLEKLQDRALYHDTDSVIYLYRPGDEPINTGPFLGQMTDELAVYGHGSYITELVALAPKCYSYNIRCGGKNSNIYKSVCKSKGITLNWTTKDIVNFESLKEMAANPESSITVEYPSKITRVGHHRLVNKDLIKTITRKITKRVELSDGSSIPHGYRDEYTDIRSRRVLKIFQGDDNDGEEENMENFNL